MPARNGSLDLARLLAAFGILVFHAGVPVLGTIGHAGLPFFLMVLVVLGLPAARAVARTETGFRRFAADRAARLLGPWVLWSAVYGALKLAEVALTGRTLATEFRPWMLLTGPALHLWFLPFAFAVSLLLPLLARGYAALPPPGQKALILGLLAGALVTGFPPPDLPIPLAQWAFALPSVLLGLALALGAQGFGVTLTGAALLALAMGLGWTLGWTLGRGGMDQIALAFGLLILCLAAPLPDSPLTRFCARAALWVYLGHPLVFSLIDRARTVLDPPGPAPQVSTSWAEVLAAMVLCLILAFVLDRLRRMPCPLTSSGDPS